MRVEPQIERRQNAAQKGQRLTRDAKPRPQPDPPTAAQDGQASQPRGSGQNQLVLEDPQAGQPDDQAEHTQAAAQGQHPLNTARVQQGLEHSPQRKGRLGPIVLGRSAGRIKELMDLRARRSCRRHADQLRLNRLVGRLGHVQHDATVGTFASFSGEFFSGPQASPAGMTQDLDGHKTPPGNDGGDRPHGVHYISAARLTRKERRHWIAKGSHLVGPWAVERRRCNAMGGAFAFVSWHFRSLDTALPAKYLGQFVVKCIRFRGRVPLALRGGGSPRRRFPASEKPDHVLCKSFQNVTAFFNCSRASTALVRVASMALIPICFPSKSTLTFSGTCVSWPDHSVTRPVFGSRASQSAASPTKVAFAPGAS